MGKFNAVTYAVAKKYVDDTADALGAVKGAPCRIKQTEHKDGRTKIVFEWTGDSGAKQETTVYVYDGTPIYVWESGNTYKFGDLVIYESAFYRCITENSDTTFDDTKFNEIGSPDGSYDIVQSRTLLPPYFTAADRKLYYSIEENIFYLWNGTEWQPQTNAVQYPVMPVPRELFSGRVVQYIGEDTADYVGGYFYECVHDEKNDTYLWEPVETQEVHELTEEQVNALISYIGG